MKLSLRTEITSGGASINRNVREGLHTVKDVFPGFANSPNLIAILEDLPVSPEAIRAEVTPAKTRYMRVSERDGHIIINMEHLRKADWKILYLDLLHELVHVRQYFEGIDLYDDYYAYVDRPTEIEAYELAVKEARRIGMPDEEIAEYLRLEWITNEEHLRLSRRLGVGVKTKEQWE